MRFGELKPGDVMTLAGHRAVILAIQRPHPLNSRFMLVVWWLFGDKRTSFDMLYPDYELISGSRVDRDGFVSYRRALDEMRS